MNSSAENYITVHWLWLWFLGSIAHRSDDYRVAWEEFYKLVRMFFPSICERLASEILPQIELENPYGIGVSEAERARILAQLH
jgi:hypothetical protein